MQPTHAPRSRLIGALALLALLPLSAQAATPPLIAHELTVRLDPAGGRIEVRDQLRFPPGQEEWTLLLHAGLDPRVSAGAAELDPQGTVGHLSGYRLRLRSSAPVTLSYSGPIRHPLVTDDEGGGRLGQQSVGSIEPDGVALDGAAGWYPRVPDSLQRFRLQVALPEGWIAVAQGAGPGEPGSGLSTWSEDQPQEDIHLIAAPFHLYRASGEGVEAQVYLRTADEPLAQRYLQATRDYVGLYARLIGPYPYAKFALVENTWDSGYGMPSFTLLGPRVIRLPFIIHTSFPHEILHNWWGNGVYVAIEGGNWCEGLTNYLADHLLAEQAGRGAEFRRDTLKGYADYVRAGKDFALVEFRERHGSASQSIGYGKGAMLFHMLRRQLGDEVFYRGLRRFYADNRFRRASYQDIERAFAAVSGRDLGDFFTAWTERPGAPRLALQDVTLTRHEDKVDLRAVIRQTQEAPPFPLQLPIRLRFADGSSVRLGLTGQGREAQFESESRAEPTELAVDPEFDLFRELVPGETPVALSTVFGADQGLLITPSDGPAPLAAAYRQFAADWVERHPGWQVVGDDTLEVLPDDRPVWLLGWENRLLPAFANGASEFALDAPARHLSIDGRARQPDESLVLTRWRAGQALAWLAAEDPAALPALARKLPHYGRYSYLVFAGAESTNRVKGQWPAADSALTRRFDQTRAAP